MDDKNILIALEELNKWEKRYKETKNKLKNSNGNLKKKRISEIKFIEKQISYYFNLIIEMKNAINPNRPTIQLAMKKG